MASRVTSTATLVSAEYCRVCTVPFRQPREPPVGRRWTYSELETIRQEEERTSQASKCFWLPMHLSGTEDLETWPESLQRFPWKLPREEALFPERQSIPKVCKALRKHYPDDETLMRFADFVESVGKSDPSVVFDLDFSSTCPDGNQGCLKL